MFSKRIWAEGRKIPALETDMVDEMGEQGEGLNELAISERGYALTWRSLAELQYLHPVIDLPSVISSA